MPLRPAPNRQAGQFPGAIAIAPAAPLAPSSPRPPALPRRPPAPRGERMRLTGEGLAPALVKFMLA
ncbi:hypothetical protein PGN35_007855 [Nodosilinea sp. PGN35]|uniref:hypothetical protein n=1 Tax=Nodosilinea sp. PGN35 TaxID=3020489 RepID=UPI00398B3824